IRNARLGLWAEDLYVEGVFPDKPVWVPAGITIPWFDRDDLVMVNVRRPSGSDPKYRAVRGSRRGHPYPSRSSVLPGQPVARVEGEFEALLLGQQLGGLLPAVTFGSASDHPTRLGLDPLLPAPVWYVAADADSAGDRSAEVWAALSGRCRRVR